MKGKDFLKNEDEDKFRSEIMRWQKKVKNYKAMIKQNTDLLKQGEKRLKELLNMTLEEFKKK